MVRMHAWAAVAAMLVLPAAASSPVMAQVMAPFEIDAAPSARPEKAVDLGGSYAAIPPDEILPPSAIKDSLRAAGFAPVGTPRLQGGQYRVGAISADGEEGRVMVDGRSGKILRFIPASADYGLLQRPVPRFREAGPIPRPKRSPRRPLHRPSRCRRCRDWTERANRLTAAKRFRAKWIPVRVKKTQRSVFERSGSRFASRKRVTPSMQTPRAEPGACRSHTHTYEISCAGQAAALSPLPITCGWLAEVVIGMLRGFFASGISRTRSTCSRPFSSEAFFTVT